MLLLYLKDFAKTTRRHNSLQCYDSTTLTSETPRRSLLQNHFGRVQVAPHELLHGSPFVNTHHSTSTVLATYISLVIFLR